MRSGQALQQCPGLPRQRGVAGWTKTVYLNRLRRGILLVSPYAANFSCHRKDTKAYRAVTWVQALEALVRSRATEGENQSVSLTITETNQPTSDGAAWRSPPYLTGRLWSWHSAKITNSVYPVEPRTANKTKQKKTDGKQKGVTDVRCTCFAALVMASVAEPVCSGTFWVSMYFRYSCHDESYDPGFVSWATKGETGYARRTRNTRRKNCTLVGRLHRIDLEHPTTLPFLAFK